MNMSLLFAYLDPFQWMLVIASFVAMGICGYQFLTNNLHRFKMGLLFFFSFYVVLRYVLLIYFKQDSIVLSSLEATILNQLAQISQIYITFVIIFLAIDARHQSKILTKKGG